MWRFIGYVLLAGLAISVIKLALVVGLCIIAVAGLIFKTKETIGLIGLSVVLLAFRTHLFIGLGLVGLLAMIGAYAAKRGHD